MRVFFTGYMFSGKTTLGKKMARRLELPFIDLDDYFEQKFKTTILQFFDRFDEKLFRKLETEALEDLINTHEDAVISTGGGTACFNDNMRLMKKNGITIYVKMSVKSIISRMHSSKKQRPLLMDIPANEVDSFVEHHLKQREKFYKQANITIKGESADINEIARLISNQI